MGRVTGTGIRPSARDDGGVRTAVVTGASRGIGLAIAEALLVAGHDVITLQRGDPPARLDDVAASVGRRTTTVHADLADASSLAAGADAVLARTKVDVLVNAAGIQLRHDAVDFPLEDFDRVIAVNARAVLQLSQALGRPMLDRGWGRVVLVASLLSFQGGIRVPAYAVAKGAVAQLTMALANEWAGSGVAVNAVAPGYIDTEMNAALATDPVRSRQITERIPAARWGTPEDVAGPVAFLCSDQAAYVHGVVLPVDGGWLGR